MDYVVYYQGLKGERSLLESRSVLRDLQWARRELNEAMNRGLVERELEMPQRRVAYYDALDKLTRFEEGDVRLCFRMFADFGGEQVDLLVADRDDR